MTPQLIDTLYAAKKLLEAKAEFLLRAAAEQKAADECTSKLEDLAGTMDEEEIKILTSLIPPQETILTEDIQPTTESEEDGTVGTAETP